MAFHSASGWSSYAFSITAIEYGKTLEIRPYDLYERGYCCIHSDTLKRTRGFYTRINQAAQRYSETWLLTTATKRRDKLYNSLQSSKVDLHNRSTTAVLFTFFGSTWTPAGSLSFIVSHLLMFLFHKWFLVFTSLATGDSLRLPRRNIVDTKSASLPLSVSGEANSAHALTILPVEPLSSLGFNSTSATDVPLRPLNSSSSDNLTAPEPRYRCDGAAFGRNLNLGSCLDTLASIKNDPTPQTFGERGKGTWDINLPFRFLSGKPSLPSVTATTQLNENLEQQMTGAVLSMFPLPPDEFSTR